MSGISAHEQAVVADLLRLMSIKRQSPEDMVRDFRRTITRFPAEDYSEAGKLALLRVAIGVDGWEKRHPAWEIAPLLNLLQEELLLPKMTAPVVAGAVASALHVPHFNDRCLGWLLDQGVSPDVQDGETMSLRYLCAYMGKRALFAAIWARSPEPSPEPLGGYSLLSHSLMKLDAAESGIWALLHAAGASFQAQDPKGGTPAEVFYQLTRFPGMADRPKMAEIASAIEAEALALGSQPALGRGRSTRL